MGAAFVEFATGAALGALLGFILGLAHSPVVGTIVTALAGLLVTFLGLTTASGQSSSGDATSKPLLRTSRARITGFALLCIVGIALGLMIRTRSWLSPSIKSRIEALTESAAFTSDEAKAIVKAQLLTSGATEDQKLQASNMLSTLFAAVGTKKPCESLRGQSFATGSAALQFAATLGDPAWKRIVDRLHDRYASDDERLRAFNLVRDLECESSP